MHQNTPNSPSQRFTLRPYQQDAVDAVVRYFRESDKAALLVLPTGAGKSLVIAELARIARGRILVLAHVKELVQQNCGKYESYGHPASIFAAGLGRKEADTQVVFGSVQSVARNLDAFEDSFSLLIIDECHRVSLEDNSEYQKIIRSLKKHNRQLKVLGLTATPYRLDGGWIYQQHLGEGCQRSAETKPFTACVFELPLRHMIEEGYLTPATLLDAPVALYDFEKLRPTALGIYAQAELNAVLKGSKRATKRIIAQVVDKAKGRSGVMIFAATVAHAKEILTYLPPENSAMIIGDMKARARDSVIAAFKDRHIKFLVNVSVLTTGFDAPHVDLIAILRPTESVGLYQQIIGRGLRLSEGKKDCLVLDYAGNRHDLYRPHIAETKPNSQSEVVDITCPLCAHTNNFWGIKDDNGHIVEHYGRRCRGLVESQDALCHQLQQCDYRWRFKVCSGCGEPNDIAARQCHQCELLLVDPDEMLKKALALRDCMVLRCSGMTFEAVNVKGADRLKISFYDEDATEMAEYFAFDTEAQRGVFYHQFSKYHLKERSPRLKDTSVADVMAQQLRFRTPDFVIGRKGKKDRFWQITEKIFDYEGRYRRANELE
ncbi:ATP-dependent helicase [Gammaproteobacteria bacterium 45_16_T64]|nr:ATP-dependent helicase [Gammaproteobacteria bacterium 45_16_T64]